MPLRGGGRRPSNPVTFRPVGLSDTADGTNVFAGACKQLVNLIPNPSTKDTWVPRPAAVRKTDFADLPSPVFVSGLLIVGNVAYGMMTDGAFPGFDEPYAYDLVANTFYPISGVTSSNLPTSPPQTGDWTPPIMAQVGGRIIVTHPGFDGAPNKIGWLDISGLSTHVTGNITSGSAVITGNPNIFGLQPGLSLTALGIVLGAVIVSTASVVVETTGSTHSNTTLDNIANVSGVAIGQVISGTNIPAGTTVSSIVGTTVTMSQAATGSASGQAVTFTGATITMSDNASASTVGLSIAVAGGTRTAPQWGAGDTNLNKLPSVPLGVAQFNGRAYYACGTNGIPFSDALLPCQMSNTIAVQVLTTNDGLPVTALGPLMEYSALTGGIVQGLIAFQGDSKMQQITGDQATSNLSMNALPVATGTLSPLSICPTELGLAFVSPEGLRIITFSGQVTPPIGEGGQGITLPFIYAQYPSRTVAAANADVIRITVTALTGQAIGIPTGSFLEYWYHLTRKCWSGPHSFPAAQIQPWANTFIVAPAQNSIGLWQSDSYPSSLSSYSEDGEALTWALETSLLPDNAQMSMNYIVESSLSCSLLGGQIVTVTPLDERGNPIQYDEITGAEAIAHIYAAGSTTLWDVGVWDVDVWDGTTDPYRQRALNWPGQVVFKQMTLKAVGSSGYPVQVGNFYLRYQMLGYFLETAVLDQAAVPRLLSDTGIPLTSDTGDPLTGL